MVQLQSNLDDHANFQTFFTAFLLLLRCATGEGWNTLMADAQRTRSITFQCDEDPDFESIMKNNGIPNGCGKPLIARVYFFSFMIVVSLIFLNLFIAIVVDTFIGQSAAFRLPIMQNDIDQFVEIWRRYDPEATGYLPWRDMDSFIRELNNDGADFFKTNRDEIQNYIKRRAFIMNMEVPTNNGFKDFMFYDVIQLVCRHASQMKFYSEKVESLKDVKTKIKIVAQFEGRHLSDEQLQTEVNQHVQEAASKEFQEIIEKIDDMTQPVEIIADFKHEAQKIGKKTSKYVDIWGDNNGHSEDPKFGVYTSQHVMVALKIAQKWKRILDSRKAASVSYVGSEGTNSRQTPMLSKEPISHRSVRAPRSANSSVDRPKLSVASEIPQNGARKQAQFRTQKGASQEMNMPPIKEEDYRSPAMMIDELPGGQSSDHQTAFKVSQVEHGPSLGIMSDNDEGKQNKDE